MSLIFGALTPHPPLLIPEIGRDNLDKIPQTVSALKDLEGELYNMQPDTLIIISPHGPISRDSFSINLAPKFHAHMQEFGDFKTKMDFSCDSELLSAIKEKADSSPLHLQTISLDSLDHGLTVPLFYLTQHLPSLKIIPISPSLLDYQSHYEFGQLIRRVALESNKRVALVASGDLSHRLTSDAPSGYAPKAEAFDQTLIQFIEQKKIENILKLDPRVVTAAGECGLRSIIILLGALNSSDYQVKTLAYEGPFGVGYLTSQFIIK